ncbi:hypothetical protein RO3G_08569 [Rhizopus delemar RA 99-880]|uniref:Uncharacterized protein n=1 Tax=Rhizopus delemar (strain RA 99-880 / ATCC MYA-4621 / FGSC 9543 / NRRL 43880) TaxID=246409 RepID=I1C5Y4_RHIO9|nr:hypothetical protein RO3G_08569 [Rhizopus delemar RA 99-880]|eukprot:EIE83864.1 hypothetical protein RO3G_08569 [Rhizopus delemar RA 99-880]
MLESENNLQSKHKEVVCPAISKLAGDGTIVSLQAVIAYLEDYIVQSSDPNATINAIQGSWTKRIIACGKLLNVSIEKRNVNWKSIASRLQHLAGNNIVNDTASSIVSSDVSTTTTSSSCTVLKHLLTELDKNAIKQMFDQLDKSKCWILESTRQLAVDQQCELESVEQKMRRFALSCEYAHPCHSLILDLCDQHWQDVFKSEELEELFAFGKPILRSQPKELDDLLDQLEKLTSASDAYKFVQRLDYDVEKEQLKAWLATTLMSTARLFIHSKNKNVLDLMETDKLYLLWGFINSVFWDSPVQAISKEKGSMANADARNRKRLLSAMKQTPNAKQGHKMDTIYLAGDNELGCLEISGTNDTSKAMKDGQIKMPIATGLP